MLQQLKLRGKLRSTHRKIKYLRGKLDRTSTTIVTITDETGCLIDLTKKRNIEIAIIKENKAKFQQGFNSPFYQPPLNWDFGYKALTPYSSQLLRGTYQPPPSCLASIVTYLSSLRSPPSVLDRVQSSSFLIPLEEHIHFWKHAREMTSCYPAEMSFATMKAGVTDPLIAELDSSQLTSRCLAAFLPYNGENALTS
jgi:hypothetical protein